MKSIEERAKEYSLKDFDGYYTGREKAMEEGYKRFGIRVDKIDMGLSFGVCISYDKYAKECYLFINLIKWGISIGWLTF